MCFCLLLAVLITDAPQPDGEDQPTASAGKQSGTTGFVLDPRASAALKAIGPVAEPEHHAAKSAEPVPEAVAIQSDLLSARSLDRLVGILKSDSSKAEGRFLTVLTALKSYVNGQISEVGNRPPSATPRPSQPGLVYPRSVARLSISSADLSDAPSPAARTPTIDVISDRLLELADAYPLELSQEHVEMLGAAQRFLLDRADPLQKESLVRTLLARLKNQTKSLGGPDSKKWTDDATFKKGVNTAGFLIGAGLFKKR